jgi:hypothetical protein
MKRRVLTIPSRRVLAVALALASGGGVMHPALLMSQALPHTLATLSETDSITALPWDDGQQDLPCTQCNPPKRFWAGFGELMLVQAIPWAFTRYVRDGEWSRISPDTWITNLKFAWQWDNNKFANNQFAHPYHGSLYYNTGRTNGYNFWASLPWAFGGSLMWEEFGEVWAPAPNDFFNTSLGGITLGEMLYRFSSLTLDNQARGSNRVVREVGATLINPVRGFNRLVRGEMSEISANPPDWRPSKLQAAMDIGYRRFSTSGQVSDAGALDQFFVRFNVVYGDQLLDLNKAPFSAFTLTGTLSTHSDTRGAIADLVVRGNLGSRSLGDDPARLQLAAFMTYDYISNEVIDFGGQGFMGGVIAQSDRTKKVIYHGEALARFMPIAAIRSDYFVTAEGRDYDYGVGLGGRLAGSAVYRGKGILLVHGGYLWLPVVSGFSGNHHLFTLGGEVRGYYKGKYGAGLAYERLWRRSHYTFLPDVDQNDSEVRAFLSLTIPRWEQ